jgi:glycine cleavage system transcriptional repressor
MVLTAVGPDRQGLVQRFSEAIRDAGANLEDSRMAILGGEFALIVLLSGSGDALGKVEQMLPALGDATGLSVTLKPTARPLGGGEFLAYRIRISGVDHPGIVSHVSRLLANKGVNVAHLDSRVGYAPLSGTPMFVLNAELQVPAKLGLGELRREMAQLCDTENLDFLLESGAESGY